MGREFLGPTDLESPDEELERSKMPEPDSDTWRCDGGREQRHCKREINRGTTCRQCERADKEARLKLPEEE